VISVNTIGFTVGDLLTIFIAICLLFHYFHHALLCCLFDFAIAAQTKGFNAEYLLL